MDKQSKSMKYQLVWLQGGIETVGYIGTYGEMRTWLDFKEKRHREKGYTVKREGDSIYAWKKLPRGIKKRWIFIKKA